MNVFTHGATRYVALAAVVLSFAACSKKGSETTDESPARSTAAETGSPVKGDWLILHSLSDPENLNPLTSSDAGAAEINAQMYESLTTTDWESLKTIPILADSLPVMSEDKLSYDVSIRKDATFADGKPITADDFIFYLKALKNPFVLNAAPIRGYYTRVDRAEKVDGDPYRLRVYMTEPYYLGDQWVGGLLAMPKHIWDPEGLTDKMTFEELNKGESDTTGAMKNPAIKKFADWFQDAEKARSKEYLIGSGPYVFEKWIRNDRVELVRNEHYWNKDPKYGQQYPNRIIWRSINDPNAALASLKSGEIDFIPLIEKVLYFNAKNDFPKYKLKPAEYDYPAYTYIGYNESRPIFQDKLVRQALAHAIDRESIIKSIYYGMATPIQSPIYLRRPEYDGSLPVIKYDLEKAKQLLAQAGWVDSDRDGILDKVINGVKTPFRFKILLNSGNKRRESMAIVFVQALKKIGVDASTSTLDWALFLKNTRDGVYDAYIGGWAMSPIEGDMYQIWHSSSASQGGSNYVQFKNPEVDKLIEQIRGEFDFEKRKQMYQQIQQIINDEQPYNFLVTEKQTGAYSDRFRNTEFYAPRPCYNPAWWWVPENLQKYGKGETVASAQ